MATISAGLVKELRDRTGLGMMECKKALVETDGNIEDAIDNLRKNSGLKAAKKAGRVAAEGIVVTRVSEDATFGLAIEINSETDFVARDNNFLDFANAVADAAFEQRQTDVAALMAGALEERREALVQKIGENVNVRRIVTLGAEGSTVADYIHGGRIAVLVELAGGTVELGRDIAMHVAAINPQYVSAEQVPSDVLDREKAVVKAQSEGSNKPEEIVEKMIQGRIKKFLAEISLVEQPFVKDPDSKIGDLLKAAGAVVVGFSRIEVGEGIEKAEVDFAKEVAEAAGLAG